MINKKYIFNCLYICDAHSLGQDLGCFRKPASQLIKYVHMHSIPAFCIMVIPEAIFQAIAVKFAVGALNTLIHR